ncbi:MAG: thioesterase family protein [Victivallaceae bacterium]|nr:thioesterase family protein [Victivallaceae bacterium]
MFVDTLYRVPYADTDQMGVVYYANYLEYFERSRTEMMRSIGFPYGELEKQGILLPVSEAHCNYHGSARYDELLTLRSWVESFKGVRLKVCSEVRRGEELLVDGYVILVTVDQRHRVTRPSPALLDACKKLFLEE